MNKTYKTLIVDDEHLARQVVVEFLKAHPEVEIVGQAADGFEAFRMIQELKPDLLFLDIQMPKINGFELLEILPEKPAVIFATAFDEYALKAFDLQAIDYLLKPFSKVRFAQALEKATRLLATQDQPNPVVALEEIPNKQPDEHRRIVVRSGADIEIIPVQEVDYLEAYDDYVKIYVGKQYHLKKKTLSYFEKQLDPVHFFRIHRSYMLNLSKLTRIETYDHNHFAVLTSGVEIPISRTSYPNLKQKLWI